MLKPERAEILHELLMGCLTQVLHLLAQHRVARLERLPNPRLDLTKRRLVAAEVAFDTQAVGSRTCPGNDLMPDAREMHPDLARLSIVFL
jgi:hypothetical protein